jgi:DeoR/GlpR family transcriptional regulator of sugar metabolism
MHGEERQHRIRLLLKPHPMLTIQRLSQDLGVSVMTIRRDVDRLAAQGEVVRVHGGITIPDQDRPLGERTAAHLSEKQAISLAALDLIMPGDTIAIDSGSTTACLAEALLYSSIRPVAVVTHALNVATILMRDPGIQVMVSGGDLRASTGSLVGPVARKFYEQIRVRLAFIATVGMDRDGLSNSNFPEAEIKREIMNNAGQTVVLADDSKWGRRGTVPFAQWSDVSTLIVDRKPSDQWAHLMETCTVSIQVADGDLAMQRLTHAVNKI